MQRPTSLQDRENIGSSRGSHRGVSVGRSKAGAVRSTSIAVVFAGLVLATAQASAQDTTATPQAPAPISDISSLPSTTTATYGDWVLRCIKASTTADGPTAESCEIVLTIQLQGQARPIAQLAIGRRQDQNELILTAVLPVNATLAGTTLFDAPVLGSLDAIDEPVDVVDVFRRAEALPGHVDEILAMNPRPKVVWFQLGIRHDLVAARLRAEGIEVVQDRCMLADHRRLFGQPGA